MSLITPYVDQDALGNGRFRNEIAMRPVGVYENGSLLRMAQNFADGDATWGHVVTRAPLRVRTANDGMRRFYLIPGDDTVYMEMGQPFVQIGGVWTQVSLGTPSRTGHTLTWTRPQSITTVTHGGHYVDLRMELLGGFVPENRRVAFPVGLSGLTRPAGTLNIQRGGVTVARLRPFAMIDAADPFAPSRSISHQFANVNGQPFLVLTLPSLAGMARPVIDPTLELQPDGTAGQDVFIYNNGGDTNWGADSALDVGEYNAAGNAIFRTLIKFNLTSVPDTFDTATLSLFALSDFSSNERDYKVYRQKRAWTEGTLTGTGTADGASWSEYDGTNAWSSAGGFHTDDCEQTAIAVRNMTASEALNAFKDWPFTGITTKAALDLGNGWMIKADTETDDFYAFASSDNATAANRPKLTVEYTEAGALLHVMQQLSYRGGGL